MTDERVSSAARRLVLDLQDARPVWTLPSWAEQEIRDTLPAEWKVATVDAPADGRGDGGPPSEAALQAIRGAEVYIGYGIPEPLFRAATEPAGSRLSWVHSAAAGVGGSLHARLRQSEVSLTNSAGIHAEPIAETVLGMILFFARGLDFAVRGQFRREWDKNPFNAADTPVREVAGATLGIVGLGGIGREVARRGAALRMHPLAMRRSRTEAPPEVELLSGSEALDELLARSDYLVLAVPETPETRGMIGPRQLARLPASAVLVNVSRGAVLDEAALVEALGAKRLRGAALDVFQNEPLPPESPLWELEGVLVTPHVSGVSRGFWRREIDLIQENLRRYLAGEPLRNLVDKNAGY